MNTYIQLLSQLISTPSFSREEKFAADVLENWMKDRHLPVHRKGNNLWVESRPPQEGIPTILLNAHIDTVRPAGGYTRNPFEAKLEDGKLYGLGSNDDGGSLVALLATFEKLAAEDFPCRLIFSATAEEEVSGVGGIESVVEEWGRVDFGIIGEPTQMKMAVAEKGLMVLDCTTKGRSGHAARDEGDNAIYRALPDIEWFRFHRFERVSDFLGAVRMTVTQISAGTQHNVIPDVCHFVVDVRPNGLYDNQELLQLIKQEVSCEVKARSTRLNSSHLPLSHPFVQAGLSLGLETIGSPTLSNQALLSFPTLKLGPGSSARSHTADEYIEIDEIREGIEIFTSLIRTASGLCSNGIRTAFKQ